MSRRRQLGEVTVRVFGNVVFSSRGRVFVALRCMTNLGLTNAVLPWVMTAIFVSLLRRSARRSLTLRKNAVSVRSCMPETLALLAISLGGIRARCIYEFA